MPPGAYDFGLTKRRTDDCRQAFARVRFYSSEPAQDAGFVAMEALTACFNATVGAQDKAASDAAWQAYVDAQTALMVAFNEEVALGNISLYKIGTPIWRFLLGKVWRQPSPFRVGTGTPSEVNNPGEGVVET